MSATHAHPGPYCTVFVCELRQCTALSVGGREDAIEDAAHDMPIARDGAGRPVINGRTLAGALVATASTLFDVPESISLVGGTPDDKARPPSLWSVWNAHVMLADNTCPKSQSTNSALPRTGDRAGNAVRHDTRGSASGAVFDLEVLPPGQKWRLIIEVWHPAKQPDEGLKAALMLAHTLREWQLGRCWLGRRVARGTGWMSLDRVDVFELPRTEAAIDAWPDSSAEGPDGAIGLLESLPVESAAQRLDLDICIKGAPLATRSSCAPVPRLAYARWRLSLAVGEYTPGGEDKSYGLDAISIGGHGSTEASAHDLGEEHLQWAREQSFDTYANGFAPDFLVALQRDAEGKLVPFVPGSAIAGAWRSYLSRWARQEHAILDPAAGQWFGSAQSVSGATSNFDQDPVTALFGYVLGREAVSSRILISDASPTLDTWLLALLEKLALDEFSQAAFKGAKFNRMALLRGSWTFDLVLQTPCLAEAGLALTAEQINSMQRIEQWLQPMALRRVAIGGGEFRSYGHVPVTVEERSWALAGEPWQQFPAEILRREDTSKGVA